MGSRPIFIKLFSEYIIYALNPLLSKLYEFIIYLMLCMTVNTK
jgi:hypothetical protein